MVHTVEHNTTLPVCVCERAREDNYTLINTQTVSGGAVCVSEGQNAIEGCVYECVELNNIYLKM